MAAGILEVLGTALACVAIIAGGAAAGISVLKRGGTPKGATGTLGSVLSMMDPATGAPTREESAAAREELRQRRHEASESGRGPDHSDPYSGRIVLPRAGPGQKSGRGAPASAPREIPVKEPDTI